MNRHEWAAIELAIGFQVQLVQCTACRSVGMLATIPDILSGWRDVFNLFALRMVTGNVCLEKLGRIAAAIRLD